MVTASFGPFVDLVGQNGADEPDDGVAVGKTPNCVGAAADLARALMIDCSSEPIRSGDNSAGASQAGRDVDNAACGSVMVLEDSVEG